MEGIIRSCLEKDPGKRPPDFASLDRAFEEAAKRRGVHYRRFLPAIRYEVPMVGAGEYREYTRQAVSSPSGYAIVEHSEIEQFLREAEALTPVGGHLKAAEIYGSLFVPELAAAEPDCRFIQHLAINYSLCLTALGRNRESIKVLDCLAAAQSKPAEYFVNLSLAHIRQSAHEAALNAATDGLRMYPDDQDLRGNLLIAQTALGRFANAAETAKIRLANRKDVHSLNEVAVLHCKYGDTLRDLDWPLAVKNLQYAVSLLREAKELNPRYLPARFQLGVALEAITSYGPCSAEIAAVKDLPMYASDRVFLAYLHARCLDRVNDFTGCWKFSEGWLNRIAETQATTSISRHNIIRLERVRAATIADGFCIGMMKDGERMISSVPVEFFSNIVHDEETRVAADFCYLARLHEWMEEYEKAGAVLSEGTSLYPQYWELPFQVAAFRVRADDYPGAVSYAERAAELAPWKTQTWELLGEMYRHLGKLNQAEIVTDRGQEVQRVCDRLGEEIFRM